VNAPAPVRRSHDPELVEFVKALARANAARDVARTLAKSDGAASDSGNKPA
jgi:hypothetical protein